MKGATGQNSSRSQELDFRDSISELDFGNWVSGTREFNFGDLINLNIVYYVRLQLEVASR